MFLMVFSISPSLIKVITEIHRRVFYEMLVLFICHAITVGNLWFILTESLRWVYVMLS